MQVPGWGRVVGILMIVFGALGLIKNMEAVIMPGMMEMQQHVFQDIAKNGRLNRNDTLAGGVADSNRVMRDEADQSFKDMADSMNKVLYISDHQKTWMVRLGYLGLIPTFIYILAGIFLLIKRKFSLALAYGALFFSIAFSITQAVILSDGSASFSFIKMGSIFAAVIGIMADVILLIVITASDKSGYRIMDSENSSMKLPG